MTPLDAVNITILLGAVLVLAGILSSLVALRFGAPLLFVFLLLGMLAGEGGPGGIMFDDVRTAYMVGSIALALILFDGGLRTRLQAFRAVLAPAATLATAGVLITAMITAPVAKFALDLNWTEALLVGAVVASTDAAAVFLLIHARGLRLRPRVGATLEVESGTNDPFAVFLTILLVEILLLGDKGWFEILWGLVREGVLGALLGFAGGRLVVMLMNRIALPQGLHAPFVTTSALVIFAATQSMHGSGFLAAYIAGIVIGNQPVRAHNTIVVFLDAATWLAQIVMFVLLGLLVWPGRMLSSIGPALAVALTLMLIARPVAVFVCLAPFDFQWRERMFISWVGLRGAVGIFLASIPLLVGLPKANLYFDIAFVVVLISLLVQGWSLAAAARWFQVAFSRSDPIPSRVELDLPGQLEQELVGYSVAANSPYLRRGILPSWAKPALFVRRGRIFMPPEAGPVQEDDYVYMLAPPEKAQALDRFFVDMPPPVRPDPRLLGDFFVPGDTTLAALAQIYGSTIAAEEMDMTLAQLIARSTVRTPRVGDIVELDPIALVVHTVSGGQVTMVGLRLAEPEPAWRQKDPASRLLGNLKTASRRWAAMLGVR